MVICDSWLISWTSGFATSPLQGTVTVLYSTRPHGIAKSAPLPQQRQLDVTGTLRSCLFDNAVIESQCRFLQGLISTWLEYLHSSARTSLLNVLPSAKIWTIYGQGKHWTAVVYYWLMCKLVVTSFIKLCCTLPYHIYIVNTTITTLLHQFNGLFSRTTWVSLYQKGKTSQDLNEARDDGVLGCSGISWTICKQSAPHFRQITTPTPHHSVFYRPDALPDAQPTVSKHTTTESYIIICALLCFFVLFWHTLSRIIFILLCVNFCLWNAVEQYLKWWKLLCNSFRMNDRLVVLLFTTLLFAFSAFTLLVGRQ